MNSDDGHKTESDLQSESSAPPLVTTESSSESSKSTNWFRRSFNPFRIATLRGLAVLLPPLLTIILFVWAWNAIDRSILRPVESLARQAVVLAIDQTLTDAQVEEIRRTSNDPTARFSQEEGEPVFFDDAGEPYVKIRSNWIPAIVAHTVRAHPGDSSPTTSREYYLRFVELRYLKRYLVIPAFLALFLALMYLVGKLLAAGIGRIFHRFLETLIDRVPIIRNVYSSVKQVTDFVFTDNEVQFNRVVAVEYPCKGIWSMGFVTGDSMLDIRKAAGEPMLCVLMPTSPMPATGFTISVPKSQTIDLNITMDQAIQFCVSCGVVVPPHQMAKSALDNDSRKRLAGSPQIEGTVRFQSSRSSAVVDGSAPSSEN